MKIQRFCLATSLMLLVACGYGGSGAPAAQNITPAAEDATDENPLVGANFELNVSSSSVQDVNESHYVEHAYVHLEQNKSKYGLENPRSQLTFINEKVDNLDNKHVKFQQVHEGVPVWGREIIVHLDENNFLNNISGGILTGLSMLNTQPVITKEKAGNEVMQAKQWGGKGWKVMDIELYIFNQNDNNYLVYRLTLTKGLLREFVFLNAHDAQIIHRISGTNTTN